MHKATVEHYLHDLEEELRDLPPTRRRELLEEIREHIGEALAEIPEGEEAEVSKRPRTGRRTRRDRGGSARAIRHPTRQARHPRDPGADPLAARRIPVRDRMGGRGDPPRDLACLDESREGDRPVGRSRRSLARCPFRVDAQQALQRDNRERSRLGNLHWRRHASVARLGSLPCWWSGRSGRCSSC